MRGMLQRNPVSVGFILKIPYILPIHRLGEAAAMELTSM
ncbi:hypothetical protein [Azospirillum endophyticum]